MNSQLRKLAGRALDQAVPETWTTLTAEQLEKFQQEYAELIIHECILALESIIDHPECFDEEKYASARQKINWHFGVE